MKRYDEEDLGNFESLFYQTIEEKEEVNKDNKKNSNQEEGENVNKSEFGNFKLISEIWNFKS